MSYELKSARFLARDALLRAVQPGDTVVDATMGNGHDTLMLCEAVGPGGRVFAFDVQEQALAETDRRLREQGVRDRAELIHAGHEHMAEYFHDHPLPVTGFAQVILFNLGYLPGGDKQLTTQTPSTLAALRQSLDLLAKDGLICVTMYCGHPEGKKEKAAVLDFAEGLDPRIWHVSYIQMLNQKKDPPEILLITRKL